MRHLPAWRAVAVAFCLGLLPAAYADKLPLWQIDGTRNTVYLLGSVHLLRPSDYPLSPVIEAAYADAESLIMELDTDDLDASEAQALTARLGALASGNLADRLGPERYARAAGLADAAGLPLARMASLEPWLAAITVEQILLGRLGFTAAHGVEGHFTVRAVQDRKPIEGLETFEQQLLLLDTLPPEVQAGLLMQTLEDSKDFAGAIEALIAAWRSGDLATLERTMLADMRKQERLYKVLVVDRNRNWAGALRELLDDEDDYLVIVGTLHLVGDESVPAMLRRQGINARQLQEAR